MVELISSGGIGTRTTTDATGAYSLYVSRDLRSIRVRSFNSPGVPAQFYFEVGNSMLPPGGPGIGISADKSLDLTLPTPFAETVLVTDSAGNPVPNASLSGGSCSGSWDAANGVTGTLGFNPNQITEVSTDASGQVVLTYLPCTGSAQFTVTPPSGTPLVTTTASIPPTSTAGSVTFVLPPPVTLSGTVKTADGTPVPSAMVELISSGGIGTRTTTDATGAYSLYVTPGTYALYVSGSFNSPGVPAQFYFEVGNSMLPPGGPGIGISADKSLDLTLPTPFAETVLVTDSAGNPVPNASLSGGSCSGSWDAANGVTGTLGFNPNQITEVSTDASGQVVLTYLPCTGSAQFTVTPPSGTPLVTTTASIPPTSTAGSVTFVLPGILAGLTRVGLNVTASPIITGGTATGTTVTFTQVTGSGTTSAALSSSGPAAPSNFQLSALPTYYDVSTTAAYSGSITVCLPYDPSAYSDTSQVRLLHWNGSSWDDVTSSLLQADDIVCGTTTSLSPFVVAQALQQGQSISFGPLASSVYGAAPITLTATASSGLPVSYTAAGACTITGSTVNVSGVGACTVTAYQAGNASWTAAAPVSQSFAINPATLKVTAPSPTRAYGSTNPVLAPTYSGFVAGDSSASLATAPTCTTTATTASGVGTYPVTCSGGVSANYTFSYVGGTLSVAPAPLTITATSKSKAYGTALTLGTTSFTTSGLLAGATVTGVTLTSAGSAAGAAVGNYPIVPSAAVGTGLSNYAITYVPGTLTVTAVPLKITAPSPSRTYGSANPTLAPTYSGFVNGDTAAKRPQPRPAPPPRRPPAALGPIR